MAYGPPIPKCNGRTIHKTKLTSDEEQPLQSVVRAGSATAIQKLHNNKLSPSSSNLVQYVHGIEVITPLTEILRHSSCRVRIG